MPYMANYQQHPLATAAANSRVLLQGFNEVFMEEFKRSKPMFEEVCQVKKSDKLSEVYVSFVGLGLAVESNDAGPTEFEDLSNGEVKEIRNYEYRKGYRISQATLEDDLQGITERPMKALPKCMEMKVESTAAAMVGGSFTTTYGWDPAGTTTPICSTSHQYTTGKYDLVTGAAGTTWSNRLAADSAPTPDTMSTMYVQTTQLRDREGYPIDMEPSFILCRETLAPVFWAILNSANKAFEFSNTKSIFGPGGSWNMPVKVWKWLPSTTAWFMIDKENTPFIHQWRIKPYIGKDQSKENYLTRVFARMRYGQGALEPRGIWGTPGL